MDQSGYQIQPAHESDVKELKQQVLELQKRIDALEVYLNMPKMSYVDDELQKNTYSFTKTDIKEKVSDAQTKRRKKTFAKNIGKY